ncbi:MAG: hypothetical protein LBH75_04250, partial [Treponema sp.]|nr:hypothetical protein [Treponema sp.]
GLTARTTYRYYIKAKNSAGESDYSNGIAAATDHPSAPSVSVVKEISQTQGNGTAIISDDRYGGRIEIRWNRVPGATEYEVSYSGASGDIISLGSTDSSGNGGNFYGYANGTLSYIHYITRSLPTTHSYYVTAKNGVGSAFSGTSVSIP